MSYETTLKQIICLLNKFTKLKTMKIFIARIQNLAKILEES